MLSKNILCSIIGLILFSSSYTAFAKTINLYEQPKTDAKIVSTIDPEAGIVPIFTPKQGDWVKIGDPTNGNVGWAKSSDLMQAAHTASGFSFSQKTVDNGKGPQTYTLQLGFPAPLSKEQTDAFYKQLKAQQAVIEKNMQQIMQQVFNPNSSAGFNFPVIMPVVIMPPPATNNAVKKGE